MQKIISFIIALFPLLVSAQSVAINADGSNPDNSSILDIKSSNKGLLIPRLTTAQRTAIVSPAIGLTVFDSNTFSYWMYRGDVNGGWAELQHNYQNFWTPTGNSIYNNNAGNVGIGTNTPASKLTINGIDPVIGIMNNGLANGFIGASSFNLRMSTAADNATGKLILGTKDNDHFSIDHLGRVSIGTTSSFDADFKINNSATAPRFAFMYQDNPIGFMRGSLVDFKMGTYPASNAKIVFSPKNVDKIWIDENGQMGIGTSTPASELTINGTNPYLQMQHNNSNTGFVMAQGINLKIGTNSTNTTGNLIFQTKLLDRVTIDENGQMGIGTTAPTSILSINSVNPILQLKNSGVDKGFVQLVNDDIKIGTNAANTNGRFIVRTAGTDRIFVDEFGNIKFAGGLQIEDASPGVMLSGTTGNCFVSFNDNTKHFTIQKTNLGGGNLILRADGGLSSTSLNITTDGHMNFGSGLRPVGYRFSVQGKIIATDFTALPVDSWPDYVFAADYKLNSLSYVKDFIAQNKHLPNIPSAAEIEKNGIQLGDMTKRLMEKVEELTLYVIQLQEQVDELKKKQK